MGLVEALLVLGLLLVVPAALGLHPLVGRRALPAVVGGAIVASAALAGQPSATTALLTVPWLVVVVALAMLGGRRWLSGSRSLDGIAWPAALAYLAVGAAWLFLDRLGAEPVGVEQPFVLLTAVHFHYAGFTATVLAALVRSRSAAAAPRLSAAMVAAVVAAPPIVAVGFTFVGLLQVVGAAVLTAGLFALSWLTLRVVVPGASDRLTRGLLVVSSLAVVAPMLLAVQWAVGWNFGTPALSIPAMAQTHGVTNAVGFALCGVIGWRRLGVTVAR